MRLITSTSPFIGAVFVNGRDEVGVGFRFERAIAGLPHSLKLNLISIGYHKVDAITIGGNRLIKEYR